MLKFLVYENGKPAHDWPLRNSYLVGSDGNAMRADIYFEDGQIHCDKRESGTSALCLQHPAGDLGELTIQTCLLPEREEPYLLTLELARHRLMVLYNKLEDWSMFELESSHPVTKRAEESRSLFIDALCAQHDEPAKSEQFAQESLAASLDGTEELALAHSELLLNRRKSSASMPKSIMGCGVSLAQTQERIRAGIVANFDFLQLPAPWKALAPEEGEYHWQVMDDWVEWAVEHKQPAMIGPLVAFEPSNLPDWLYIWEHDYDTVRDLVYEHVERVVTRYRNSCVVWNTVSGLHVNDHFTVNFEQLMDLTRMTTMLVKKIVPRGKAIIELRQPFGEYYAGNQRSIPPLMYADLVQQSGMAFDGLGIRLPMGQATPGYYTRDLMQISNLLDQFQHFGKPLYVTLAAPSEPVTQMMIPAPASGAAIDENSGHWRRPWSPAVQSHWLEAVLQIAISKPFVEAVAWQELADHPQIDLPLSGLISEELAPKDSLRRWVAFRKNLAPNGRSKPKVAAPVPEPDDDLPEIEIIDIHGNGD